MMTATCAVRLEVHPAPKVCTTTATIPVELKITKLLIVTTGETRRAYLSHLLWAMWKGSV